MDARKVLTNFEDLILASPDVVSERRGPRGLSPAPDGSTSTWSGAGVAESCDPLLRGQEEREAEARAGLPARQHSLRPRPHR
eukprot:8837640-Pyramimonas_sp.AAC.1